MGDSEEKEDNPSIVENGEEPGRVRVGNGPELNTEAFNNNSEDDDNGVGFYRTLLPQVLASTAKNMLLFDLGMAVAFPTIVIPDLMKDDSLIQLNIVQISWFGSLAYICQPLGSLASGVFLEALGRKRAMLLVTLPHIAAWIMMFFATNEAMLFTAAVLLGLGVGFMEAPILTYVGEICQPRFRGILTAMAGVSVLLGVFLTYLLGTTWHWTTVGGVLSTVPIITFVAICFIPETPMWLLSKGRREDALESLCWLRGWVTPDKVEKEFSEIEQYAKTISQCTECRKKRLQDACPHGGVKGWAETRRTMKAALRRTTLRPALLVLGFFVFHQFNGLHMFRPYMVQVVRALGIPLDAHWATVVVSVVGLVGNIACMIMIKLLGKRKLAMISMLGCALSALLIGTWAKIALQPWARSTDSQLPPELGQYQESAWMPLVLFIGLAFFMSVGVSPIPWIMLSEVFPYQTRGMASGTTAALNYVVAFVATKSYLDLERLLGLEGMFYAFAVVSFLGIIYIYMLLPETEGRTLQEIEEYFGGKNRKLMKSIQPTKLEEKNGTVVLNGSVLQNGAVVLYDEGKPTPTARFKAISENDGYENKSYTSDEQINEIGKRSTIKLVNEQDQQVNEEILKSDIFKNL
uniref:Putative permease of the major facilitator superfamily protein n=1 Tax=Xenopsylla cheopis TaxID=163159 RepID=A0A6M2DHG4_XENCH